jgi:nucleoside-diphosphate-sugar epimerase
MSLLITGSSGFIGTNLIKLLIKKKINFIGIDKKYNKYLSFKNFYKINLNNKSKLYHIIDKNKIKYIIHLAAIPGFVSCNNFPSNAFENNVDATFNLMLLAKKYKCKKVIIASSMGVDNFEKNPSIYGLTKFICEKICKTFKNLNKTNIVIAKISNVFGLYSHHKSSVVHSFIKNIIKNKALDIHKNGKQSRDFIFAEDVCLKFLKEIYSKNDSDIIKINTNKYSTILNLKSLLDNISKKKNTYLFVKTPQGYDDKDYKKKLSKYNKDFIKKLEKTFNWYMNNRK